ncbi:MAG: glycosyltransferase [Muribaculaceae bacterium]|nr:glycosyltransferase [Muribaculaceae bacterium]
MKALKIVIISHSDRRGGAAVVSMRLMKALCDAGADASMLVAEKLSSDPRVHTVNQTRLKAAFLAEHAENLVADGFLYKNVFKVSNARYGCGVARHPAVVQADVVICGWINQGLLSLRDAARIAKAKPLIWIMHDMWSMTGVCHHAGNCTRFRQNCGHCPLLWGGKMGHDMSRDTFRRKLRLYDSLGKSMAWVCVSGWLNKLAASATLLRGRNLHTIPNPFPDTEFTTRPTLDRKSAGLPADGPLVVMGAARLDDPVKDLDAAVEALNKAHVMMPELSAVFFGNIRDNSILERLEMPHVHTGPVSDPELIKNIYAHAAVVLSSSSYETLPGTLIEGLACGAMAVSFDRGGQPDIITPGFNGTMVPYRDTSALAQAIVDAARHPAPRLQLHDDIARRFGSTAVADKILKLCTDMYNRFKENNK